MTSISYTNSINTGPRPSRQSESELLELDRSECLELLAANLFGRLVTVLPSGTPVIRPINYVFDGASQSIVFRTGFGSKFRAVLETRRATFEIDGIDPEHLSGWSVIVSGVCEEITSPAELQRLATAASEPWAPGLKHRWFRIRVVTVSGRRVVAG